METVCKVALVKDFPLRNDYKTAIYFASLTEKVGYFQRKHSLTIPTLANDFNQISETVWTQVNKPLGTMVNSNIVLGHPTSAKKYNVYGYEMPQATYLIAITKDTSNNLRYYFYFVTDIKQSNANAWQLNLELDLVTTYSPLTFTGDVFTERKHCNRFGTPTVVDVYEGYTYYQYLMKSNTGALASDVIDTSFDAQVLESTETQPLQYSRSQSNSVTVNSAVNSTMWVYMWFTSDIVSNTTWRPQPWTGWFNDFPFYESRGVSTSLGNNYKTGLVCIFAPMKKGKYVTYLNNEYEWSGSQIMGMFSKCPYLVSVQISPIAPFDYNLITSSNLFISGGLLALKNTTSTIYLFPSNTNHMMEGYLQNFPTSGDRFYYPVLGNFSEVSLSTSTGTYSKPAYVTEGLVTNDTLKMFQLEPRMYQYPYSKAVLRTRYSNGKAYNRLALWGGTDVAPTLKVNHMIDPTQDKYFACLTKASTVYAYEDVMNRGDIFYAIYNLPTSSDPFLEYLANHKNFMISGLAGMGGQLAGGAVAGAMAGGTMGAVGAVAGAVIGAGVGLTKFVASIDDLKNAPNSERIISNDLLHDIGSGQYMGFKIEVLGLNSTQKEQVFDFYFANGYRVMKECPFVTSSSTYPDGVLNRTRFNYVKLADDDLYSKITTTGLSGEARQKLCTILNNGITLWLAPTSGANDSHLFNYNYENMENYL